MNCPTCKKVMSSGRVTVHGTVIGFLIFGLSRQHLFYQDDNGEICVVRSNGNAPAFMCDECGTLVIQDDARLLDRAMAAEKQGDIDRAIQLYEVAVSANVEAEYARRRLEEMLRHLNLAAKS